MELPDPTSRLKQLILFKKVEQSVQGELLKEHFRLTYESLKPVNIIKRTFKEIISEPGLKTDAINLAIGLTTGFIAKKIFTGSSNNPFTKVSGVVLEMLIASKVSKNADEIKAIGSIILKKIISKARGAETVV